MDDSLTEIIAIVDRSGSMEAIREEAITGFNYFLKEQQRSEDGRCLLTYCQFDTEYEITHSGIPIKEMKPLDFTTFQPRGCTALHDAVGRTIMEVGNRLEKTPEAKRPGNVIVVILTDGLENSSREFKLDKIKEMVKHQADVYDWSFVFLGQNIDAFAAGRQMGFDLNHPKMVLGNVMAGGQGHIRAYHVASAAVSDVRYRKVRGLSKDFSEADKDAYAKGLISGEVDGSEDLGSFKSSADSSSPQ